MRPLKETVDPVNQIISAAPGLLYDLVFGAPCVHMDAYWIGVVTECAFLACVCVFDYVRSPVKQHIIPASYDRSGITATPVSARLSPPSSEAVGQCLQQETRDRRESKPRRKKKEPARPKEPGDHPATSLSTARPATADPPATSLSTASSISISQRPVGVAGAKP